MRVVCHIHATDIAGMPYRLQAASNRGCWKSSRIQLGDGFSMGFPPGDPKMCLDWYAKAADILHFHHASFYEQVAKNLKEKYPNKPFVVTIHGSPDRERPTKFTVPPDAVTVVTADLLQQYPEATNIPNFILDKDAKKSSAEPNDIPVLFQPVAHHLKDWDKCKALARALSKFVTLHSMPGEHAKVSNKDQLERMRTADFVWDHFQGYHGIISIEAMASSAVPIVGVRPDIEDHLKAVLEVDSIPWITSIQKAAEEIKRGAEDPKWLSMRKKECRDFYEIHWNEEKSIQRYFDLYDRLLTV